MKNCRTTQKKTQQKNKFTEPLKKKTVIGKHKKACLKKIVKCYILTDLKNKKKVFKSIILLNA